MSNFLKKMIGLGGNKKNKSKTNNSEIYQEKVEDNEEEILDEDWEEEKEDREKAKKISANDDDEWIEAEYEEGQLSIDVYQTDKAIIVKSTIAGVKAEDIDISINNDMLTIRGKRNFCEDVEEEDYLYKECYWGSFSRSVILPTEIQVNKIAASLENGVLTVTLPKAIKEKKISVKVKKKE